MTAAVFYVEDVNKFCTFLLNINPRLSCAPVIILETEFFAGRQGVYAREATLAVGNEISLWKKQL